MLNTATTIGYMPMPVDFKYKEVFLKGRPRHSRLDEFAIRHPGMPNSRRAKIFSPFDALKGFSEAVAAKEVQYVFKQELSEEEHAEIERRLEILHSLTYNSKMARANNVVVSITYFVPCMDVNHSAYGYRGSYEMITGACYGVDPDITRSVRVGSQRIPFEDITEITSADGQLFHIREWD